MAVTGRSLHLALTEREIWTGQPKPTKLTKTVCQEELPWQIFGLGDHGVAKRSSSAVKHRSRQQRDRVGPKARLYAFEGPDGAGKSTIVQLVARHLRTRPVSVFALPGREQGSLGAHVYKLHHDAKAFNVDQMSPAAKQLLHVAAHADFVEMSLRPRMDAGETVLLDRYWWSMWVYGTADGMNPAMLDALIACERAAWGAFAPAALFVVTRTDSLRAEDAGAPWRRRQKLYLDIAEREVGSHPVHLVSNDGDVNETVSQIVRLIAGHERE